jgi:uncharacterized protein (TIGR04255 family)
VVETVIGVQFDPIEGLNNARMGSFWAQLQHEWPSVADAPPLTPQYELFGDQVQWAIRQLRLRVIDDHSCRLQIRNAAGDRMLQVQNGRFHYNWIGRGGGEYARYERIRTEFNTLLDTFAGFVEKQLSAELRVNQWEVTYVNHLSKGTVWHSPADWQALFPALLTAPPHAANGIVLESLSAEWHYEIEPKVGRLHVELSHGKAQPVAEEPELLVLKLTARGPIKKEGAATFDAGIDLGHAMIVKSFSSLTSQAARDYWEQE